MQQRWKKEEYQVVTQLSKWAPGVIGNPHGSDMYVRKLQIFETCRLQPHFKNVLDGQLTFKGIAHLNIIFSYMKFNKICNLDHPVF